MAMQSLTVDLDGPYHYADHGGDGPPMVLLHGIGGSHLNWMSVAPTLAQSFHVYALDMIGFGFTPNGRRDSKLPTQARYVDRFIGEVAGAPAVVMGHSMGGLVAMLLAAQYPAVVERLVAVDPAACVIRSQAAGVPTWLMLALAVFPDIGGRLAGQIARRRDTEELVRETLGRAYGAGTPIDPAAPRRPSRPRAAARSPAGAVSRLRRGLGVDAQRPRREGHLRHRRRRAGQGADAARSRHRRPHDPAALVRAADRRPA